MIREAQREGLDREPEIRGMSDSELESWIVGRMYDPRLQGGDGEGEKKEEVLKVGGGKRLSPKL